MMTQMSPARPINFRWNITAKKTKPCKCLRKVASELCLKYSRFKRVEKEGQRKWFFFARLQFFGGKWFPQKKERRKGPAIDKGYTLFCTPRVIQKTKTPRLTYSKFYDHWLSFPNRHRSLFPSSIYVVIGFCSTLLRTGQVVG